MKNFKNSFIGIITLLMLLTLAACGSGQAKDLDADGVSWAEKANLDKYETTDELYEKAKEEGEVVVYTATSAVEDIGLSFEKEYPGIKAKVTKVSDPDILEKLRREHEAGVHNADIIFGKGTNGAWVKELLGNGIIHDYKPEEIVKNMAEPYKSSPGLGMVTELITVLYNTDVYDEPPFDNWWDLTTPEWKGKVMMKDPLKAADIQGVFMTMVKHSDEMEKAYKEKFGEEIVLNDTENAGYEFVKRLLENDAVLMSSMGDSVDAVAESTQDSPPIAIASTTKLRDVVEKGAPIAMSTDLQPKISVPDVTKVFFVDQAPNSSAAKLFVRWMFGGEDGNGEGFAPFRDNPGVFTTRTDMSYENELGLPSIDALNLWEADEDFYYENERKMRDLLLKVQ